MRLNQWIKSLNNLLKLMLRGFKCGCVIQIKYILKRLGQSHKITNVTIDEDIVVRNADAHQLKLSSF